MWQISPEYLLFVCVSFLVVAGLCQFVFFRIRDYLIIRHTQDIKTLSPYLVGGHWKKFAKQRWDVVSREQVKTLSTIDEFYWFLWHSDFLDSEVVKEAENLRRGLLADEVSRVETKEEILDLLRESRYCHRFSYAVPYYELLLKKLRQVIRRDIDVAKNKEELVNLGDLISRYFPEKHHDGVFGFGRVFINVENAKLNREYSRKYTRFLLSEVLSAQTGEDRCFDCHFPYRYKKFTYLMKTKQDILFIADSNPRFETECGFIARRTNKMLKRALDSFGK